MNKTIEKQTYTCERCETIIHVKHRGKHTKRCNLLPTPAELAERMLRDDSLTVTALAKEVQGYVSRSFTDRVNIGLAALGKPSACVLAAQRREAKQGGNSRKKQCPRCKLYFVRVDVHQPRCDKLPLPVDLAREFIDKKLMLSEVSYKYTKHKTDPGVRERLWHGLQALGVTESPQTLSAIHRQDRAHEEESRLVGIRARMVRCKSCRIDIAVAPPGRDGVCGWCLEPILELSRSGDVPYQDFEVNGEIVLQQMKGEVVVPFSETVTAVDERMAERGLAMRIRAKHGHDWKWYASPAISPIPNG